MTPSSDCSAFVMAFEKFEPVAYLCPAGVLTIGYGHTNSAGGDLFKEGERWSEVRARIVLDRDLARFARGVESSLKGRPVSQFQFDALVSFAFNVGIVAFRKSTVLRRVLAGDEAGAGAALLMWTKAGGKTLPGLVRRRKGERELFEGDIFAAMSSAHATPARTQPKIADAPRPPKGMAASKTGNAAVAAGGSAALVAWEAGKSAIEQAGAAKETARNAGELFGVSGSTALLFGAALVILAGAAFIWWDRRRKLHLDLV